jgi:hypothetical protein
MTDSDGQIRAKIDCMLGQLMRAHEDMLKGVVARRTYIDTMDDIVGDLTRLAVYGKIPGVPGTPRPKSDDFEDFSKEKENFIAP